MYQSGILQDVALDDAGDHAIVVPGADMGFEDFVFRSQGARLFQKAMFVLPGGQFQRGGQAYGGGHGFPGEIVQGIRPHDLEHVPDLTFVRSDMPGNENTLVLNA